uniref:Ig-like domain-containing protein n=1 Tax=Seriola dumerili TaxID=41447 RepID=A0A3B4URN1_SERDU
IRGTVGHDVILPCYVEPPFNVTRRTVDWKFGSKFVYVYRHNGHDPDHQHADFKNRTYVDEDEMSKGNLSLRIFPLKKTDAGNYTCSVPEQSGKVMKVNTELIVGKCTVLETRVITLNGFTMCLFYKIDYIYLMLALTFNIKLQSFTHQQLSPEAERNTNVNSSLYHIFSSTEVNTLTR